MWGAVRVSGRRSLRPHKLIIHKHKHKTNKKIRVGFAMFRVGSGSGLVILVATMGAALCYRTKTIAYKI